MTKKLKNPWDEQELAVLAHFVDAGVASKVIAEVLTTRTLAMIEAKRSYVGFYGVKGDSGSDMLRPAIDTSRSDALRADEEFCRRMRNAIEAGKERMPVTTPPDDRVIPRVYPMRDAPIRSPAGLVADLGAGG